MKLSILPSFLFSTCLIFSCQNNPNTTAEQKTGVPKLSKEVEAYDPTLISDDLVMAVEGGGKAAYILNKAGEKVFKWTFEESLGNDVKLLPNGKVLGMFKASDPAFTFAGGYGGVIKIINPDNTVEWEYEYAAPDYLAHHEAVMLPNGNIMFLAWEKISAGTAKKNGVNVAYDIYPEKIVEVDTATNEIVWQWRSWEHIVQDVNPTLANYGKLDTQPNKININYALSENGDIMHANGIAYDATRDVIFVSVNHYDEIWVIDHSTSIEEAASSYGGNYNHGGDLIYRFGNPTTYNNSSGRKLFDRIHFPNLLAETDNSKATHLLIYVNGMVAKRSTVYELEIPDTLLLKPDADNEPTVVWSFSDSTLSYGRISGADRLTNGNTLICEGDYGFWEVTPQGEVSWKYKDPSVTFWRGYAIPLDDKVLKLLGVQ